MIGRLYFGRVVLTTTSTPASAFAKAIRFSTFNCVASISTRPRIPVRTRARSPNSSIRSRDDTRGSVRISDARVRPSPPTPRMATRMNSTQGPSVGLVFSREPEALAAQPIVHEGLTESSFARSNSGMPGGHPFVPVNHSESAFLGLGRLQLFEQSWL